MYVAIPGLDEINQYFLFRFWRNFQLYQFEKLTRQLKVSETTLIAFPKQTILYRPISFVELKAFYKTNITTLTKKKSFVPRSERKH